MGIRDRDKPVVRSEMRSESSTQGRAAIEGGVPDPNFRGDGPSGTMSDQNATQETRTTNFEINKEEQNIVSNVGVVDRLPVAVIVDHSYAADAEGNQVFTPRSDEDIRQSSMLVATAGG